MRLNFHNILLVNLDLVVFKYLQVLKIKIKIFLVKFPEGTVKIWVKAV